MCGLTIAGDAEGKADNRNQGYVVRQDKLS